MVYPSGGVMLSQMIAAGSTGSLAAIVSQLASHGIDLWLSSCNAFLLMVDAVEVSPGGGSEHPELTKVA